MENQFKDKVAIVTGGSFGIGSATAILFAKHGAKVAIADIIEDSESLNTIKKLGGTAIFIKCDVSKEADVIHMINETVKKFGRIDFAFNNAGTEGIAAPVHECTNNNWTNVMNVNIDGVWLCMKHEIPHMLKLGKGAIVNNASVAGLVGFAGTPAYVASKHAVVGLTKNAALDYAKLGIRVNVVCPGIIKTPMIDRFTGKDKKIEKQFIDMEPVGRLGEPEEVAEAVKWLCSEASSFVAGQALAVDGGWVAQ